MRRTREKNREIGSDRERYREDKQIGKQTDSIHIKRQKGRS